MQTKIEMTHTEVNMNECDAKGRAVGKRVTVRTLETTFTVQVYTLRDGKKFGAIPPSTGFATLEEAQALAAKKIAALEKKAFSRLSFSQVDGE